jgi:hypothetical protein
MTARAAAALLCIVFSVSALGQELEVFDVSDFIDPRDRGAVFDPTKPFGLLESGQQFLLMRAYTGRVLNDYQWRNAASGAEANFLHLTTNLYRGDKQYNAKLTFFQGGDDAHLTSYRGTLQYAQYFVTANSARLQRERGNEKPEEKEDIRIAGRYAFTLSAEHNPYSEGPRFLYEYGIESTGYVRYRNRSVVGSLVWTHRTVSAEKTIDRISYYYRLGDRTYRNGLFRWNANLGFGAERNDGWHFGATRVVMAGSVEIPVLRSALNVAYAPTYLPGRSGRKTYHEVVVFLDSTVLSHIGNLLR